jgi:hypothetical protein
MAVLPPKSLKFVEEPGTGATNSCSGLFKREFLLLIILLLSYFKISLQTSNI